MKIPTEFEDAETFIGRVANLLRNEGTHVYFDTSFLMWLTTIGPISRSQFFDWSQSLSRRSHVPLWAMHEYYRHHTARTLKRRLERRSGELVSAAGAFAADVHPYADRPLFAGQPEAAYRVAVQDAIDRLSELAAAAIKWDYDSSAAETLGWMNARTCEMGVVFEQVATLKAYGAARYTQDIPPGFLDRRKVDRADRGSNRYGDLLFWEEVMAHAAQVQASSVVVITNDRKEDWFFGVSEPEVGSDWKRLRSRWKPVPAPHPTLAFELKIRTGIAELALLDELYLGAILWKTARPKCERFASVAIDIDPGRFADVDRTPKPAAARARKRRDECTIGLAAAVSLVTSALGAPKEAAIHLLEKLDADAESVDSFVGEFKPKALEQFSVDQVVNFAKQLHDRALLGPGPAESWAISLLSMLDQIDADRAAAVYLGFAVSAYFIGVSPRNRPDGPIVQALFEWQVDSALTKVLQALGLRLKRDCSAALYIPNAMTLRVRAVIEHDPRQQQNPVPLRQLYFDGRAILTDGEPRPENQLRTHLNGKAEASVRAIVQAACRHYGVPFDLTDIEGGEQSEVRFVPETFGFQEFDRFTGNTLPSGGVAEPIDIEIAPGREIDAIPDHDGDVSYDLDEEEG